MASVNKLINKIIIPTMIVIYLLFLIYDFRLFNNGNYESIVENHQNNVKKLTTIEALILGGSNAAFGLSAEQLTRDTQTNWYNASLMHEGFSDINYHNFVKESFEEKRLDINSILYSPMYQFRNGVINNRMEYKGKVTGPNDFNLRPRMSILGHIRAIMNNTYKNIMDGFPLPNKFGDFVFDDYLCKGPSFNMPFEHEDIDLAASYLAFSIKEYLVFFPNAKILLSHPPEFYGSSLDQTTINIFQDSLNKKIINILEPKDMQRVRIVNQVPIINDKLICEGKHHLNAAGRMQRTEMIFKSLP